MKISKIQLELWAHRFTSSVPIFITLFALAYFYNNYVGIGFLLVSFISLRYCYNNKTTFHCITTADCIKATCLLFSICGIPLIVFNSHVSLLASVPISICATYYLYEKQVKINTQNELLELTKPKLFHLDTCTNEELMERCKELKLKPQEIRRAVWIFADRLSNDEIILADYKITGKMLDYDTVYKIKTRLKKKLS